MDRQGHEYAAAAAMAFAQQQQQQQPPHQQFLPSVHVPPFLPPHPSIQQFPRHPLMQQPPQIHPHPPPHLHLLHQQPPPSFPPHMPPHLGSGPFHGPYDTPPPPAPPPSDPEQQKCIDKLVEYAVKNGPEFEAMIREKQKDNPAYSFLFGGEGHVYYRYSLQRRVNPHEIDNEALAFRHVLGSMLARIYHNPSNKDENQSRLQKIVQFWASKEVYDPDTIRLLENEMLNGPPVSSFPPNKTDLSTIPGQNIWQKVGAGVGIRTGDIPLWTYDVNHMRCTHMTFLFPFTLNIKTKIKDVLSKSNW